MSQKTNPTGVDDQGCRPAGRREKTNPIPATWARPEADPKAEIPPGRRDRRASSRRPAPDYVQVERGRANTQSGRDAIFHGADRAGPGLHVPLSAGGPPVSPAMGMREGGSRRPRGGGSGLPRHLPRSSRRPAFERGAPPGGHLLDPGRAAEREPSSEGTADRLHLGLGLVGRHLAPPGGSASRLVRAEVGPLRERGQQRVGPAFAVRRVARPSIGRRVGDHPGPQRVGLDVAEDGPEMVVGLDDGALEPTLPDVPTVRCLR